MCRTQLYVLWCAECAAVRTCAHLRNFSFSRPVIFDAVPEQCNLRVFYAVQLFFFFFSFVTGLLSALWQAWPGTFEQYALPWSNSIQKLSPLVARSVNEYSQKRYWRWKYLLKVVDWECITSSGQFRSSHGLDWYTRLDDQHRHTRKKKWSISTAVSGLLSSIVACVLFFVFSFVMCITKCIYLSQRAW